MTSPAAVPSGPRDPPAALIIRGGYVITMDPGVGDIPAGDVLVTRSRGR